MPPLRCDNKKLSFLVLCASFCLSPFYNRVAESAHGYCVWQISRRTGYAALEGVSKEIIPGQ